jgi:hypothetical protein
MDGGGFAYKGPIGKERPGGGAPSSDEAAGFGFHPAEVMAADGAG